MLKETKWRDRYFSSPFLKFFYLEKIDFLAHFLNSSMCEHNALNTTVFKFTVIFSRTLKAKLLFSFQIYQFF